MKRADNLAEPAIQASTTSPTGPTLRSALLEASAALAACHESAWLEAELLLAHVLHRARSHLHAHPEECLDAVSAALFCALLQRRIQGEPLAYLTGEREFWSLPLTVSPTRCCVVVVGSSRASFVDPYQWRHSFGKVAGNGSKG